MKLEEALEYMQGDRPYYLSQAEAIAYICWHSLNCERTYGLQLLKDLREFSGLRLSDTVLYSAIAHLREAEVLSQWTGEACGRGRPPELVMVQVNEMTEALAHSWMEFLKTRGLWEV